MELETFNLASSLLKKLQLTIKDDKKSDEESVDAKALKVEKTIESLEKDFSFSTAQKKSLSSVLTKAYKEPEVPVFSQGDKLVLTGTLLNLGLSIEKLDEKKTVTDLITSVSKLKSKVVNDNRKALFTKAQESLIAQGKEVTADALVDLTGLTVKEAERFLKPKKEKA